MGPGQTRRGWDRDILRNTGHHPFVPRTPSLAQGVYNRPSNFTCRLFEKVKGLSTRRRPHTTTPSSDSDRLPYHTGYTWSHLGVTEVPRPTGPSGPTTVATPRGPIFLLVYLRVSPGSMDRVRSGPSGETGHGAPRRRDTQKGGPSEVVCVPGSGSTHTRPGSGLPGEGGDDGKGPKARLGRTSGGGPPAPQDHPGRSRDGSARSGRKEDDPPLTRDRVHPTLTTGVPPEDRGPPTQAPSKGTDRRLGTAQKLGLSLGTQG